jgi:chemotaxis methyl-accepting protein methylase/GAF domain-containing protein
MEGLEQYVELLRKDRSEVEALFQDLLIRVTSFFRQPEVFEMLKDKFFPQIASARAGGQVRFWVPGCSTGEEAYSLAIAWAEFVSEGAAERAPLQVFASDINQQVIDKARVGIYPESIAADVSPERLARFFQPAKGGYQIAKEIRETCVFAKHDLARDPPFSRIDLVSLRNVLIYLGPLLQRRIMPELHFAIQQGGFLLLGDAESVGGFTDLFSPADKKAKIYTRRDRPGIVVPPVPGPSRTGQGMLPARPPTNFDVSREADRILLEAFTPVGVIVDADLNIREFRGSPTGYLEMGPGRATLDLLHLARQGLALELGNALREAKRAGLPVHRNNVRILREKTVIEVGFDVVPMKSPVGEVSFLVLFHEMSTAGAAQPAAVAPRSAEDPGNSAREKDLESQMRELREYVRAVIEDKEAANEELRSANEELQSANEELESTSQEVRSGSEELRSLNDELHSINERLEEASRQSAAKNAELTRLNAVLEQNRKLDEALADLATSSAGELNEAAVLRGVLGRAMDAFAADRARYLEPSPKGWTAVYTGGLHPSGPTSKAEGLSPGLIERLQQEKAPFLVSEKELEGMDVAAVILVPVVTDGRLVGIFEFGYKDIPTFTGAHYQFSRRLSFIVSLGLQNARLYEGQRDIAERMQGALLDLPKETGRVKFAHLYRSATKQAFVGGDFYDVFEAKKGCVAILIGDVSGHGVEAARVATLTKDVVHAFVHQFWRPSPVLRKTNELLIEKSTPGFVTLFLGILDPNDGTLHYSSAGHPNVLLRKRSGEINVLEAGSAPLAVHPSHSWNDNQVQFELGDVLLLYTDGLTEARQGEEFFGHERLVEALRRWPEKSVDGLPETLLEEALAFSDGVLADDVALLAVERREETRR